MSLSVSEIFRSIQGEGRLAGVVSGFVRLAGCDLHCRWCDTPYARKGDQGSPMTIDQIVSQLSAWAVPHIVITGGEPLLADELPQLLQALKQRRCHITLETAATIYRPITCDLLSISPKLSNSDPDEPAVQQHADRRLNIAAIQQYIDNHDYQLKFVVERPEDLAEIEQLLGQLSNVNRDNVLLMPQATTAEQHQRLGPIIAQLCIERNYRYCPRLQVLLWDRRRGV
ncbi:MAG: 7-carboxy-7-deazaguanine synthase QueE [Sedimentisphaerales bacterium]|nr:7-carboxy-7-deazaguanine synthase QueE [Sedimentisphaerales bacterium]